VSVPANDVELQEETAAGRFPPVLIAYVLLLTGITLAILPAGIRASLESPLATILWVVFIAAANLLTIPMLPKMQVDASLGAPVSVAAAVLLDPAAAVLVNFLGFTNEREIRREATIWAVLFNRSQFALSAGLAALAAHQVGILLGTVAAVVVFNISNTLAVTLFIWGRQGIRLGNAAKDSSNPFPRFFVDWALVAMLAVLIVVVYDGVGGWVAILLALPLWLGYSALRSAREAEDRAEQLAARVHDLETLNELAASLLRVRVPREAAVQTGQALSDALGGADIEVVLDGAISQELQPVKVIGAEPAVIGVPQELPEDSLAVVEAAAGLLGMAVQRLQLEQELTEVERARVALSGEILEEGTRERSRIALEIHDDVLPYFAAAEMQADNVQSAIRGQALDQANALALRTRDAVHDGIARLREVLEALRRQIVVPGSLRDELASALEKLRVESGVQVHLDVPEEMPTLPLAVEILVFETVRGCLTNVARHAGASRVSVAVRVTNTLLEAEVRDDGRGFDPSDIPAGHHGLVLMAQRVELARGRFVVTSGVGAGTTIHLEVPL
jgi:signal transduction histidine kinase